MASEIEKLQREFFEYLEIEKGSSARTIENYQHYLGRFLEHTKIKTRVTSPTMSCVNFACG